MLDERKTAILSAIVHEYVATAQPVGSTRVAYAADLGVSSATVRNEMVVLEREGYLAQPHTSAGRVPTDKGYRFFVDQLTTPNPVDATVDQRVGDFFAAAHGRLEEMLHQTSELLARLTRNAAVVLGPRAESVLVRSVQLVRLAAGSAAVIVVFANGTVTNDVIEIDESTTDEELVSAALALNAHLDGRHLDAIDRIAESGDARIDNVIGRAIASVRSGPAEEQVFVGGTSTVAEAFDAVEVVREVLHTLDQQLVVVSLVRDIVDRGMSVAIGGEHGVQTLATCSVVVAPVVVDGENVGSVGVLGPTRMNYPQALATVDIVSDRLGKRLGDT